MNNLSDSQQGFDSNVLYLGDLCIREHNWNGSGKSLRYKSGDECVACRGVKKPGSRRMYKSAQDKFWEKVDRGSSGDCWLWRGRTDNKGYGQLDYEGRTHRSHRFSYMLHFGEIPDGLHVLHHCDCPPCVNPAHLFLGTNMDNVADKVLKKRQHIPTGSKNGRTKLIESEVREIRSLYSSGMTCKELTQQFCIPFSTCWKIVTRRSWKHID